MLIEYNMLALSTVRSKLSKAVAVFISCMTWLSYNHWPLGVTSIDA